ncbi:hypothetical protein RJ639_046813 [Escallonia herrerae]|uniref:non-specific serine/threonine protein kinase n=1 Tax=Escallonia herrerae TaxID=1293975 RepID=A0AA89AZH3_9ASTE|nr:hypothetical protein RJ639_046813 [Escallonia herrerae]
MEGFSWLVFSFNLIVLLSRIAIAADTLTYGSSHIDGQTLVSASQVFELGFFSPGISKSRYLGIWYKNISFTAAWVANRGNPIPDLSGTLIIINKSGILGLSNRNGTVFWSSKSGGGAFSLVAQILDNGNLVLRQANVTSPDSYIWQSFDFPTDTLLPGMKQGWNLKTGLNRNLTSWKSSDDP